MTDRESYIRQETVTGVVPMLKGDRQYSFLDLFLSTSGFAIATWCYTQGAYVAQYLSFSRMLINIFCFNIVWVFIECLPVIFATRYGIDLWIWLRSVLGRRGVAVLSTIISVANFGWYAVAASLFSSSMINLAAKFGLVLNAAVWSPVLGCLCVVLGTLIALGGPNVIKWTNRFLVTALLAVGVVVVVLCFTAVPLREIVAVKPVLDAVGIMSVSSISFLSGCTVLAMSIVSVYKNLRAGKVKLNVKIATALAVGAAAGGVAGKAMFQGLKDAVGDENLVGMVQAIVLIAITLGTLIYTVLKNRIKTKQCDQIWLCLVIGLLLGIMSSFLGIGGGPINLVVLAYFFSMSTKEAALSSLYIIMFSQITSLIQTLGTGTVPEVKISYFLVMVIGGIAGGMIGSKVNKKIDEENVNKLFIGLMAVIIGINIYNAVKFGIA